MPKAQAPHYKDYQHCFNLGSGALKHGLKIDVFSQFKDLYKLIRNSHSQEAEFYSMTRTRIMHQRLDKYILVFPSTRWA